MAQNETRSRGRPSKGADNSALKAALLDAALALFGEKGFEGASLSMIAQRAKTDTALSRYYFGSKQGLWTAAIDHLTSQLDLEITTVLQDTADTNVEKLKAVIQWFVHMSAQRPYSARILVFEGSTERTPYVAQHLIEPFYALLSALIDQAKVDGHIPKVETRTIFFMITHGGSFPMSMPKLTNAFPGGNIRGKVALERHAQSIIQLIVRDES